MALSITTHPSMLYSSKLKKNNEKKLLVEENFNS